MNGISAAPKKQLRLLFPPGSTFCRYQLTNFPLSEGLALTFNLIANWTLSTSSPLVWSPARPAAHVLHGKRPLETRAFSRRCRAPRNPAKTAAGRPQDTRRQQQQQPRQPPPAQPPRGGAGNAYCRVATTLCPAPPGGGSPAECRPPAPACPPAPP